MTKQQNSEKMCAKTMKITTISFIYIANQVKYMEKVLTARYIK